MEKSAHLLFAVSFILLSSSLSGCVMKADESPDGDGWFVKISVTDPSELDGLMDEDTYREYVDSTENH